MTLNGRNEINKNSGAHQKNFNEDRPMSVVAKCRPMHLFYKLLENSFSSLLAENPLIGMFLWPTM